MTQDWQAGKGGDSTPTKASPDLPNFEWGHIDPVRARLKREAKVRQRKLAAQAYLRERNRRERARIAELVESAPERVKPERRAEERAKGYTDEQIDARARREMAAHLANRPGMVYRGGGWIAGEDYYDLVAE